MESAIPSADFAIVSFAVFAIALLLVYFARLAHVSHDVRKISSAF